MNLPDFLKFKPFNYLREVMGADQLGDFEFFDPERHLSAEERQQLQTGLRVPVAALAVLGDKTLAYKNGRVLVSAAQDDQLLNNVFHLAACNRFQQCRGEVSLSVSQPRMGENKMPVCEECLQELRYKGFDAVRNRHRHYSQRLLEEFSIADFFAAYPAYPLDKVVQDQRNAVV